MRLLRVLAWLGTVLLACAVPAAGWAQVAVLVNAAAPLGPISPLIYGISYGSAHDLAALNVPIDRMGGDSTSTYAWRPNAENLAADYYFESYPQAGATPGAEPDSAIAVDRQGGAVSMMTVPMMGGVARLGPGRAILPSFSVRKYGKQCSVDYWDQNAGDGVKPDCVTPITGNAPTDAYSANSVALQQAWLGHLQARWGSAANGGVGYYLLDNEPSIWFSTHRDLQPIGLHAKDYVSTSVAFAAMIHAADPTALVVGPEEWGWDGYLYSGYDQQYGSLHGWSHLPDRQSQTGGMDYLPWLLTQWKAHGHPVDVLSVHFYPQGGEFGNDDSSAMQLLRNRSTRQLWDPNYVSESWIDTPVNLIPRLKNWLAQDYYPGTPIALTEYNWGDDANINGATTQADLLGIFGTQGLTIANRWTAPAAGTPTYKAIQMFRNYDGHDARFGDTALRVSVPDPDTLSAFAATRTLDGAMTVMVVNKSLTGAATLSLTLSGFAGAGAAKAWQLTSADVITPLADVPAPGGVLQTVLPAQSVTLYVLASATAPLAQPPTAAMAVVSQSPYAPAPGQPLTYAVSFNARASAAAAGQAIAVYRWDFGDGTTGSGRAVKHVYTAYGTYQAQLTVVGSNGLVDVATAPVQVLPELQTVSSCTVAYAVTQSWSGGFSGSVAINNTGTAALPFWQLSWSFAAGEALTYSWNGSYAQAGATVTMLPYPWTQSIPAGGSVTLGFDATAPGPAGIPTGFSLNGTNCAPGE